MEETRHRRPENVRRLKIQTALWRYKSHKFSISLVLTLDRIIPDPHANSQLNVLSSSAFQPLSGMRVGGGELKFNLSPLNSQNTPCLAVIWGWQRRRYEYVNIKMWEEKQSREITSTTGRGGNKLGNISALARRSPFFLFPLVCFLVVFFLRRSAPSLHSTLSLYVSLWTSLRLFLFLCTPRPEMFMRLPF